MLFPILGGSFSILYILILIFPLYFFGLFIKFLEGFNKDYLVWIVMFAALFIVYLGIAFCAIFFNVCTIYTVKVRFDGGNAGSMESIRFALNKLSKIFLWSLIFATIGLVLGAIDKLCKSAEKSDNAIVSILGFIGDLVNSIFGFAWGLVSAFVLPLMVYRDVGPIEALKKSEELLKKTWGESLTRDIGFGLVGGVVIILGIVIFGGLAFLVASLGIGFIIVVIVTGVVYLITLIIVGTLLNTIFNTALFIYADKGVIPLGYNEETMKAVFRVKEKK